MHKEIGTLRVAARGGRGSRPSCRVRGPAKVGTGAKATRDWTESKRHLSESPDPIDPETHTTVLDTNPSPRTCIQRLCDSPVEAHAARPRLLRPRRIRHRRRAALGWAGDVRRRKKGRRKAPIRARDDDGGEGEEVVKRLDVPTGLSGRRAGGRRMRRCPPPRKGGASRPAFLRQGQLEPVAP